MLPLRDTRAGGCRDSTAVDRAHCRPDPRSSRRRPNRPARRCSRRCLGAACSDLRHWRRGIPPPMRRRTRRRPDAARAARDIHAVARRGAGDKRGRRRARSRATCPPDRSGRATNPQTRRGWEGPPPPPDSAGPSAYLPTLALVARRWSKTARGRRRGPSRSRNVPVAQRGSRVDARRFRAARRRPRARATGARRVELHVQPHASGGRVPGGRAVLPVRREPRARRGRGGHARLGDGAPRRERGAAEGRARDPARGAPGAPGAGPRGVRGAGGRGGGGGRPCGARREHRHPADRAPRRERARRPAVAGGSAGDGRPRDRRGARAAPRPRCAPGVASRARRRSAARRPRTFRGSASPATSAALRDYRAGPRSRRTPTTRPYGAFLGIEWNLFDGFARENAIREAQAGAGVARAS